MMGPTDDHALSEPYDESRGTCPVCDGSDVKHLVIGFSGPDAGVGSPDWVEWIGCLHPGYDRICGHCGFVWTAP